MAERPRVLFLLKYRKTPYGDASEPAQDWGECGYPGRPMESGIYNSARMSAHMLERLGADTALAHVVDADCIHREAVAFNATHVIIEAFWVTPVKFSELHQVLPDVHFIVRNHSESPFLANEGVGFEWTLKYLKRDNVQIAPNSPRMLAETRFLAQRHNPGQGPEWAAERVPFLPNYYILREEPDRPLDASKPHVDVGCFGAIRPLKNPIIQAIAALRFAARIGKPLRFHINASRVEGGGEPVLKSLRSIFAGDDNAELVEHSWRPHGEFLSTIIRMDLVAQVSFTETFNIVAADALADGTPLVTSSEVPWSSPAMQADPNDSDDIARVMQKVYAAKLNDPSYAPGREGLRSYNARSREAWASVFLPEPPKPQVKKRRGMFAWV